MFTPITVTAKYVEQDAVTPASGTVEFLLTTPLRDPATNEIRTPSAITATLDAAGEMSVVLTATDDAGVEPAGVAYQVTERIGGGRAGRVYYLSVPAASAGGTLDLADVAQGSPTGVTYSFATTSQLADAIATERATERALQQATYVAVVGTEPAAKADWWLSTSLADLAIPAKYTERNVLISPSEAWEGAVVQEPSVWYDAGLWHMIYTGGFGGAGPRLGYASCAGDPTAAANWTKTASPVIGGGAGGHAGAAYHSNVYREGSTLYCHYVNATTNTELRVATASVSAPTVWTDAGVSYALPSGSTLWGNVSLFKEDDGTYTWLLETSQASSWQLSLGTSPTPTGALTVLQASLPTLRPSAPNATATTCGPWLAKEGDLYILWYHSGRNGSLPTQMYRATSLDKITWTIDNDALPIADRAHPSEVDQVADVHLAEGPDGEWFAFWSGMDNVTPAGRVMGAALIPTLKRRTADGWVRVHSLTDTPGAHTPSKPAAATLAVDFSTTSTAFVDTGLSVKFIPTGTKALVRLSGAATHGTAAGSVQIRVTDGGSKTVNIGGTTYPAAGGQIPLGAGGQLTGLTPGQRYTLKVQVKVGSGTWYCRPVSFPDKEVMTVVVEDSAITF